MSEPTGKRDGAPVSLEMRRLQTEAYLNFGRIHRALERCVAALFVPPGYDARDDWPMIVFLHGLGERGEAGDRKRERPRLEYPLELEPLDDEVVDLVENDDDDLP